MSDLLTSVSWIEIDRDGDFVLMRQGTGMRGWWHLHANGEYLGNPMDFDKAIREYVCRECGAKQAASAWSAKE